MDTVIPSLCSPGPPAQFPVQHEKSLALVSNHFQCLYDLSRVVLFLDYQSVCKEARACFHNRHDPHLHGQISPLDPGLHIVGNSPYDRELLQVRVYRGRPTEKHDVKVSMSRWPSTS